MPYKTPPKKKTPTPSGHGAGGNKPTPKPAVKPWTGANGSGTSFGQNSFEMRLHANEKAKANANGVFGPDPVDPYNGATIFDLLAGMDNRTPSKGGRGGGGGGGGYGASAASKAAFANMLATLSAQAGTNNKLFDDREASLRKYQGDGDARLAGILTDLTNSAAATRGQVAGAYQGGDARLAQMAQEIAAQEASRAYGLGQTQQMFGASPMDIDRHYGAVDSLNAQRGMLAGQAGSADAMYANRGNVYNGLMGDAKTGNSQMFDQLLAQLAAQRNAQAMADQQAQAQLKLQAAQSGVTI